MYVLLVEQIYIFINRRNHHELLYERRSNHFIYFFSFKFIFREIMYFEILVVQMVWGGIVRA